MNEHEIIARLEAEWELTTGFLGRLREGHFDVRKGIQFLEFLRSLKATYESQDQLNKRCVSLLWYIPLFMSWQFERVAGQGGDTKRLKELENEIEDALTGILGLP